MGLIVLFPRVLGARRGSCDMCEQELTQCWRLNSQRGLFLLASRHSRALHTERATPPLPPPPPAGHLHSCVIRASLPHPPPAPNSSRAPRLLVPESHHPEPANPPLSDVVSWGWGQRRGVGVEELSCKHRAAKPSCLKFAAGSQRETN